MHECPVLDMRRVSDLVAAFDACHQVRGGGLEAARWERVALPCAGGALEQPMTVMDAFRVMESTANDELASDLNARGAEAD